MGQARGELEGRRILLPERLWDRIYQDCDDAGAGDDFHGLVESVLAYFYQVQDAPPMHEATGLPQGTPLPAEGERAHSHVDMHCPESAAISARKGAGLAAELELARDSKSRRREGELDG